MGKVPAPPERLQIVVEDVAETIFLRAEIVDIVRVGNGLQRNLFDDFDAIDLEPADFLRIVRQDFDLL